MKSKITCPYVKADLFLRYPQNKCIVPNGDHCDRIHSSLTAVYSFDDSNVAKQPVARKEYCARHWLKELHESMDRYTGRRDVTEILLNTALNIIQSIIQSRMEKGLECVVKMERSDLKYLSKLLQNGYVQDNVDSYLSFNSLPNDKVFDWSKLKAFASFKINVNEKLKFLLGRVETLCEKEKMLVTSIFSFSHNVF